MNPTVCFESGSTGIIAATRVHGLISESGTLKFEQIDMPYIG
jgi:hypothetical protein